MNEQEIRQSVDDHLNERMSSRVGLDGASLLERRRKEVGRRIHGLIDRYCDTSSTDETRRRSKGLLFWEGKVADAPQRVYVSATEVSRPAPIGGKNYALYYFLAHQRRGVVSLTLETIYDGEVPVFEVARELVREDPVPRPFPPRWSTNAHQVSEDWAQTLHMAESLDQIDAMLAPRQ